MYGRIMKAAVWKSIGSLVIEETDIPEIKDGEVLIKVAYAGICGSDFTILNGKHVSAKPPIILGHEFSGIVAETRSKYFKNGDRVAVEPIIPCGKCKQCNEGNYHVCRNLKLLGIHEDGGFADYVKVNEDKTFKVPDSMDLIEAAVLEPFSVALHGIDASQMKIGDAVLVVGSGPVGIITALLALRHGAGKVIVSELSEYRLNMAKKLGIIPFNPNKDGDISKYILDNTCGYGVDRAFECGGTSSSVRSCLDSLGIKGKLVQVGVPKEPLETDYRNFVYKEQEVVGIRIYKRGTFLRSIKFLKENEIKLKDFVSDIFNLEDILKAFECANDKERSLKVLIKI